MSDCRRDADSAVNADEKISSGLSRRGLLLGLFALPVAAILEPEPALAQFGGLLGALVGGGGYRRRSYRGYSYHRRSHYRPVGRRHRYGRSHVLHRSRHAHRHVSHHAHGGGHRHGGGSSGPGGGSLH